MAVLPVMTDLPVEYLSGIGKVVAAWAVLEHELRNATFAALNVGPKHGRTAVRAPRTSETTTMIAELLSIDDRHVKTNLTHLGKTLEKLEASRDVLCHSLWLRGSDGSPMLQDLAGKWQPDVKKPPVRRRIHPQAMRVKADDFDELEKAIYITAHLVLKLRGELAAMHKASPGK